MTAETVATAFIFIWVSRFGVADKVTTDQGRQFESNLFQSLSRLLGALVRHTTPYHPSANGMVERRHRTYKAALRCKLEESTSWVDELPLILLGLRSCLTQDSDVTVAERVYGTTIRLPSCFIEVQDEPKHPMENSYVAASLRQRCQEIGPVKDSRHGQRKLFKSKSLDSCSHVFMRHEGIRKSLDTPYDGPYRVLDRNEKYFRLQIEGREVSVSV
ncbi:gag-pol protein, partial [Lasius niger]